MTIKDQIKETLIIVMEENEIIPPEITDETVLLQTGLDSLGFAIVFRIVRLVGSLNKGVILKSVRRSVSANLADASGALDWITSREWIRRVGERGPQHIRLFLSDSPSRAMQEPLGII